MSAAMVIADREKVLVEGLMNGRAMLCFAPAGADEFLVHNQRFRRTERTTKDGTAVFERKEKAHHG